MGGIWNKLRRQDGASLLVAFLFLLLCAMVGVSILMAAVSNAGKIRSNQQEQQKYLTLSSAIRLVCEELAQSKYVPNCDYEKILPEPVLNADGDPVLDANGNPVMNPEYTLHIYTQHTGACTGSGLVGGTGCVLPLLPELDWLFAKTSEENIAGRDTDTDHYIFQSDAARTAPGDHSITLHVEVDPEDESGLGAPVQVTVRLGTELEEKYNLVLTAVLEGEESYSMSAELYRVGNERDYRDDSPLSWRLSWIAKEAEDNETAGP